MSVPIKLRKKDIGKFSGIVDYPTETVQMLNSMNLLSVMEARNLFEDWRRLKRGKKYTV